MNRTRLNRTAYRLLAAGAVLTALACEQSGLAPELDPDFQSEDLTIINDEASLARRVTDLPEDTLVINPPADANAMGAAARVVDPVTLTRVAEVSPPELDGVPMQATHIATYGVLTYVAYGTVGATFGGGVDVFSTLTDRPRLLSQALVNNADVHSVSEEQGRLYVGMSTDRADYESPAAMAEIRMLLGLLTTRYRTVDLPSYAATSVVRRGDAIYVTTGSSDDGGLYEVDVDSFGVSPVDLHRDARAVDADDDYLVTMSGTPGVLRVYDAATGAALGSYAIGGANIPESKSAVAVANGFAFVAAGDAGLLVVRLRDGEVVADVPMARMTDEMTPDHVTNGVTVNDDLVFLANGAGGMYVLRHDISRDDVQLTRVGNVRLLDGMSVNHIGSRGSRIFIASGTGGLQIVRIAAR